MFRVKNYKLSIYLTILLISLVVKADILVVPFLQSKYIYWLFIAFGGSLLLLEGDNKKWVLNPFDHYLLILSTIGFCSFFYLSNASIFNVQFWYFTAYLFLYIILRKSLNKKSKIQQSLNTILYFLFLGSVINTLIAILQAYNFLSSFNENLKATGLFYSPNQLGLFLALGVLSGITLLKSEQPKFHRILFYIFLIVIVYGLFLSQCRGAWIALIVSGVLSIGNLKRKITKMSALKIFFYSIIIQLVVFLFIWNESNTKSESASGRIFITKQIIMQLKEKEVLGYGFDSFALHYNLAKAAYFSTDKPWQEVKNASYIYNANNDFLELSYNFGLVWTGFFVVLTALLLYISFTNIKTKTSGVMLLCLIIYSLTNTILPIPLFIVLGCFFTVIIINELEIKPVSVFQNPIFTPSIIAFAVVLMTIILIRINAEYHLMKIYNRKEVSSAKKVKKYVSKIDANGEECFMGGIILLKNNEHEGLQYLLKGFELSGKPTLGKKLASLYERMGKYKEAESIYIYNRNTEPFRFEARLDLFNLYLKTNQKEKAVAIAKEILHLPIKIPSKKIDLIKIKMKKYLNEQKIKAV